MDVVYCVILSTLDARAEEEEAEANNNCDNPSQVVEGEEAEANNNYDNPSQVVEGRGGRGQQ